MIKQFFRVTTIEQAMELKQHFQDDAVWMAGGSKLNATPTRTECSVAISLQGLPIDKVEWDNGTLRVGSLVTLQKLRDTVYIPQALYDALGFVYSRHVRNQATLGGEIAAHQPESVLIPLLLVLETELLFADGEILTLEEYLQSPGDRLLVEVIIHDLFRRCATRKFSRSAGGWSVVTAAVAITENEEVRIALDGVAEKPIRVRDVESLSLQGEALEKAISAAIHPHADLSGSKAFKRHIAGVLVADLLTDCLQQDEVTK
ncbi:MAG TPA: molybdopterin-dependent oxidoreductase FAD-binding subunit [Buttiauxella sp.]|uniref:molybdopterin-dependent oxidoreductase FAD-binding subunit n=1 Tax=Buttiauxella sp. TaxID=1972222 RepID=UPI002B45B1B8|nr:molybdopterin-dependent oxidoreductase FAD-binding subunit [Buttiauxella sp.]HKM96716.1 molybdopterin-dependent oxidoreductase FAD-binding subunit [Buttiauxella sp.]